MIYVALGFAAISLGFAVMAWRARGGQVDAQRLANEAADRTRIAEAGTEAQRRRADDAEARALSAVLELRVSKTTVEVIRAELLRERKERQDDLEILAKAGAPVGGALVDAAIDRVFTLAGAPSGADPGPVHRDGGPVPPGVADPPGTAPTK